MTAKNQPPCPPVRVDVENEWVWHGEQRLKLTPKAFAVLRYLAEHPGRLVTKDQLLHVVWPDTVVSEWALTSCLREIRKALKDTPQAPQYIETVHRRGVRFIAPVTTAPPVSSSRFQVPSSQSAVRNPQSAIALVGREMELRQLHSLLENALGGERQIVFVTGEPGIGKTTLVEAFLEPVATTGDLWIGRGQCIEHYGAGEAYLPVLEALGRLCREPEHERLIKVLHQHAPTWLVQMPALLSAADLEALQRKVSGATRERMLREMAEALEALTTERGLVLWLEDLHWSDYSTLDLLASLSRRLEKARLLVLGTYRPVDVIVREHPLKTVKQELQLHGQCEELPLELLSAEAVEGYLAVRFPGGVHGQWKNQAEAEPLQRLARMIYQRTEGNPLFMVNVVDELIARAVLVQREGRWELAREVAEGEVPASLRHFIEQQLERVSPVEQQVLEAASAAGMEFSAAAVAAGLEETVEKVEKQCERLARREQFLQVRGMEEWPDGTVAARYGFIHALYHEVLYDRVTAGQRSGLHRRIGEREEAAYGPRAGEVAAELAVHFERGREYRRAVQYLEQAGKNGLRRSAHQEAIALLTKGLELLKALPDTPKRTQQELRLQITLGGSLQAAKGYAALEVEHAYARALELCRQVGETPQLLSVLGRLLGVSLVRGELQTARELGEQLLTLAQREHNPALLLWTHMLLGQILFFRGELIPAQEDFEQGIALYDPQKHRSYTSTGQYDPGVTCFSYEALALWPLGYPDQALKGIYHALTLAQELAHPFSLAHTLYWAAWLHQYRREEQTARARAEALITLSTEQEFRYLLACGTIYRGWVLAEQGQAEEGTAQIRPGIAAYRAMGTELGRPYHLALLADAYGKVGQAEEGLNALAEALAIVDKTGERLHEAELHRLKGTLTLQSKIPSPKSQVEKEAEECFWKAIEIARRQQAKSWELRAVMSLAQLWQQQGKKEESRQMLAEIYSWFTEGFDTADLKEAKALLEELTTI